MNILIGADFVPTKSNIQLFETSNIDVLFGKDLCKELMYADYRIFNLEVPLTDVEQPILKCGPALIAPTKCIRAYQDVHVDLLTLANNHILDQNYQGLKSTIKTLEQAGISYIGAGENIKEASKPFIFECDSKRIGVYACAEHEFSIASENIAGANPADWLESPDHVANLKNHCDYVIVLYHGGKEHYRYPSPNLQRICRKFVEKGADLVVCQHSHCIGCEERYLNGSIVYGQGNFLFDDDDSEFWQTSLLISIQDNFEVKYIPIVKQRNTVRIADKQTAEKILDDFILRSNQIKNVKFIKSAYERYSHDMLNNYMKIILQKNNSFVFKVINKLTHGKWSSEFINRIPKEYKTKILNFIECEAHRELFIRGIKEDLY